MLMHLFSNGMHVACLCQEFVWKWSMLTHFIAENLFISALSTCTYEYGSCTYDCTCERVEELYTCMRVCVYEQWNFDGFIMLQHALVIDMCWSIYLFNMYVVNLRVLIICTCVSVNKYWLILCCMHVISTWKSWFCLQIWRGDVDEFFMRCEFFFLIW